MGTDEDGVYRGGCARIVVVARGREVRFAGQHGEVRRYSCRQASLAKDFCCQMHQDYSGETGRGGRGGKGGVMNLEGRK